MADQSDEANTPSSSGGGASGRRRRSAASRDRPPALTRGIEICLALAICVPPFVLGGREAFGQLTLAVLVLAMFSLWTLRRIVQGPSRIPLGRPEIVLVAAAFALSAISWTPLPPRLIETLSPGMKRLLPAWSDGGLGTLSDDGGWRYLSLAPGLSRDGALLFTLYVLLFWITIDTVRNTDSARRLVTVLFVTGVGVAVVGILHYLFWNGKFYGYWELWWVQPDRQVRAPFTNRNHFAGYLALTIVPGVVTLTSLIKRWKRTSFTSGTRDVGSRRPTDATVLVTALGVMAIVAAIFLSQSRGGGIVALLALVAVTIGLLRAGFNRTRSLAAMALLLLGGVGTVVAFAREDPFERGAALLEGNQSLDDLSNQRLRLWQADVHALLDFPATGSGVGTHVFVNPLYLDKAYHVTFTHAENSYLQIIVESGLLGGALLAAVLCCVSVWCLRNLQGDHPGRGRPETSVNLAIGVGLLVALVHGVVDFVWYVPAYAATLAVLAGLACSLYRKQTSSSAPLDRQSILASPSWLARGAWGCGLALGWFVVLVGLGRHFIDQTRADVAWNAYFRLLPDSSDDNSATADVGTLQNRADLLAETCRHGSSDPDHHYRLGLANLELFLERQHRAGKSISIVEARAILRTEAKNPVEAAIWLDDVYGNDLALLKASRASFRRSLECCPLYGPAYVRMAELSLLDDVYPPNPHAFCREALLVRPNDPDVHLQVGLEEWMTGDFELARACWAKACAWQPSFQLKCLPLVAEVLPAADAADFLPWNMEALKWLAQKEVETGRRDGLAHVAERAQELIQADPIQSKNPHAWLALSELYQDAEVARGAEASLRHAVQLAPTQAGFHLRLVRWMTAQKRWEEALDLAQDARRLCPYQAELQNVIRDIVVMKDASQSGKSRRSNVGKISNADSQASPAPATDRRQD